MAICSHCGGEMTEGISCLTDPIIIGGKAYAPIPWGQELRPRHRYEPEECRDCGTPLGGIHHPGCCMERCPACHGQAIGCDCLSEPDCDFESGRTGRCTSRAAAGRLALRTRPQSYPIVTRFSIEASVLTRPAMSPVLPWTVSTLESVPSLASTASPTERDMRTWPTSGNSLTDSNPSIETTRRAASGGWSISRKPTPLHSTRLSKETGTPAATAQATWKRLTDDTSSNTNGGRPPSRPLTSINFGPSGVNLISVCTTESMMPSALMVSPAMVVSASSVLASSAAGMKLPVSRKAEASGNRPVTAT